MAELGSPGRLPSFLVWMGQSRLYICFYKGERDDEAGSFSLP